MANEYIIQKQTLDNIAIAINNKIHGSEKINPIDMPNAIESIETGTTPTGNIELTQQTGSDVSNYATASVRSGSVSVDTPTISSNGLVTASASVGLAGLINSSPSSKTLQLSTQAAKTITPNTTSQTAISANKYTTGDIIIEAVPTETKTITENGVSVPTAGKFFSSVTVNLPVYDGTVIGYYAIVPVTLTWQHNQYVTLGLEISADGSLRIYKASGSGTANNPVVCYPQSDTYSASSEITTIPIPKSAGTHTMDISVWWDNSSGVHGDHNNHTISFEVVEN